MVVSCSYIYIATHFDDAGKNRVGNTIPSRCQLVRENVKNTQRACGGGSAKCGRRHREHLDDTTLMMVMGVLTFSIHF